MAMNEDVMERMGTSSVLRDEGALESTIMRPHMAAHYEEADLITQTAVLIIGIALAHPFIDGNKRTALAAGTTFLLLNGFQIVSKPEELGRQIEAVVIRSDGLDAATSRLSIWLRSHVHSVKHT
ncbi:MAG: type II toxin-antitoxin system death-on-curing family toxin [Chloroflexota bacterium]|nr:type II toxin-antitoxin system death-on-curing family toxin [Chloroflexota bacterium]